MNVELYGQVLSKIVSQKHQADIRIRYVMKRGGKEDV